MADQEHWAERRQRAARCKVHGLHYDPQLTSGCTLCRKEGLAAEPRQKPQLVVILLALLGVAVILYRVFGPGAVIAGNDVGPAVETPTETTAVTAAAQARLDPERYRAALEAVDQSIFQAPADSLAELKDQVVFALRRLRSELAADPANTARLVRLDELIDRLAADTLSFTRLAELRREWTRLRNQTFRRAPWMLSPGRLGQRADRAVLVGYRNVASELDPLLDEGRVRAESLLTPRLPNVVDEEEQALRQEQWREFATEWRQRIEELRLRLPPRPAAAEDPRVLVATQQLERSLARALSLAAAELPPPDRFDDAFDDAERARRAFDELLAQ